MITDCRNFSTLVQPKAILNPQKKENINVSPDEDTRLHAAGRWNFLFIFFLLLLLCLYSYYAYVHFVYKKKKLFFCIRFQNVNNALVYIHRHFDLINNNCVLLLPWGAFLSLYAYLLGCILNKHYFFKRRKKVHKFMCTEIYSFFIYLLFLIEKNAQAGAHIHVSIHTICKEQNC